MSQPQDTAGKPNLPERRRENRLWCSDMVEVSWKETSRWSRKAPGVLEDISSGGLCVQLDVPVPEGGSIRVHLGDAVFEGTVRYCCYRETGYFVGIQLDDEHRWQRDLLEPGHLLDPDGLAKPPARDQ